MKGAQLPFQEYWGGSAPLPRILGGYSPPSPPVPTPMNLEQEIYHISTSKECNTHGVISKYSVVMLGVRYKTRMTNAKPKLRCLQVICQ